MTTKQASDPALEQAMKEALEAVESREAQRAEASAEADPEGAAQARVRDLETTLAQKTAELATQRDQMLRLAADFDNFRKRSAREQEETRRFGAERLLRDVLPVLDNFDRALAHAQGDADPLVAGIRMVAKQLTDTLSQHGVRMFSAGQEMFDPERHEAIGQVARADLAAGTIVEEVQRGYMLHDRLLRPARVLIAASPEGPQTATETQSG